MKRGALRFNRQGVKLQNVTVENLLKIFMEKKMKKFNDFYKEAAQNNVEDKEGN